MKTAVLLALHILAILSHEVLQNCTSGNHEPDASCSNPESVNLPSDMAELTLLGHHAFQINVRSELITKLIDWCNQFGILDMLDTIAEVDDNPLDLGEDDALRLRGYHWWVYRDEKDSTDAHYFIPDDEIAYSAFLSLLQEGGMNEMLRKIGDYFEWETLTVYHVSIVGFSYAAASNIHKLSEKMLQVVVPVFVPSSGSPEIYVSPFNTTVHRNSSALVLSNGARLLQYDGDLFLALHMLIADVNEANIKQVNQTMSNSNYPRQEHLRHLIHWSRLDTSKGLPKPIPTAGDFVSVNPLAPGQVERMRWAGDPEEIVHDFAFQVGLPSEITRLLRQYCDDIGITETFRNLLIPGNAIEPDTSKDVKLNGMNWYIQRPNADWNSNMHWISPLDKESQDDYLNVLAKGGFDQVLRGIGKYFDFEGLVAYQVTFIGVSHCEQGFDHHDFLNTDGRAFNVIIPLLLANDLMPELEIMNDDGIPGSYKYELGIASMVGDGCIHATSAVDYRGSNEMRMAATVYVADVRPNNVDRIMSYYTQRYPPGGDTDIMLSLAASHWKRDDEQIQLQKHP